MGSISRGTCFVYRGVTHAYDLGKASQGWRHARNFMGIVLEGFSLLLIEMGLAHFLKHNLLSIWASALNQVPPPPPTFGLMFQDYFLLYFIFNVLRLLFVSFDSIFQDFSSLTHTKNSLHFHSPFFTSIYLDTHAYSPSCHPISNTLRPKTMSFTFNLLTTPT